MAQSLVEYALIVALVVVVAVLVLMFAGGAIMDTLSSIGSQVGQPGGS